MMSGTGIQERRDHPRATLSLPVQLRVDGADEVVTYVTRNISSGGLFIETDAPLPIGTTVSLLIHVPSPDGQLQAEGTVVRSALPAEVGEGAPGMAIRFDGDALIGWEFLRKLVES